MPASIEVLRLEFATALFIYGIAMMSGALAYGLAGKHKTRSAILVSLAVVVILVIAYYRLWERWLQKAF